MRKALIIGAGGRDFHNAFFLKKRYKIEAFTQGQLPVNNKTFPKNHLGYEVPIYKESEIEKVIVKHNITDAFFSYSDVPFSHVFSIASRVMAKGANFHLLGKETMLKSKRPVIAITATRTGSGKSPLTELISLMLKKNGYDIGIIRHPMPYKNLSKEVEVFRTKRDLKGLTLEEIEDYERHIENNFTVYAGINYKKVLKKAEKHDIIIWDGGNNDFPFIKPDFWVCVADATRAGDELTYYPSPINFFSSNAIVISKYKSNKKGAKAIEKNARKLNKKATLFHMDLVIHGTKSIKGKRVVVVEDGPTTTHGQRPYGAGYVYAKKQKALIVNAKQYAKGFYKKIYDENKHIKYIIPAVGYSKQQLKELEKLINSTPADAVVIATPIDLAKYININKECVRVFYKASIKEGVNRLLNEILTCLNLQA